MAICILLTTLLCSVECSRRKDKQLANENLKAMLDSVRYYKNRLGTHTATVKVLQLDKKNLQQQVINRDKQLSALSKEFTSVKNVVKIKEVARFDSIYLPFREKIPSGFTIKDTINTKQYGFTYKIDSAGLSLQNFTIPNETTIITGYKQKWFLGRQTITTDVTNSNPYISTESIVSAEVVVPEPWYKKWYVWLAAGLITGVLVK